MKQNNILEYIKKVFRKWFIYLSFIPGLLGTIGFYFGTANIILSWQFSLYIFIFLLLVSSYFVWKEQKKETEKLQNKLQKIEAEKPELSLRFEGNKKTFLLKNKFFERTLDETSMKIKPINSNVFQRMINSFHSPVVDEIQEAFVPLRFELHNEDDFKATDVNVDIYFPKELTLIEELPQQTGFIHAILPLTHKRMQGRFFQKKNHLRLWCDKSKQSFYNDFEEVYIFSSKKGKFKIKYEIHSDELDSKGIKGELTIDAQPKKETKEYSLKSELERDQIEYESLIETKLKQIEDETTN